MMGVPKGLENLQVKPERPSTHPGMVQTNSNGLLNSLYPFMPEIP